jgi:hypothetical protein
MPKFWMIFGLSLWIFTLTFTTLLAEEPPSAAAPQPAAILAADLAIESFTLSPAAPFQPGQPITLTAVARNLGDTTPTGRRIYLYLAPAENPPLTTTLPLKEFVAAIDWPPGDSMTVELANVTVRVTGCHRAYAWVDPLERIAESNETNNLAQVSFCVQYPGAVSTGPDAYETDNLCADAKEIVPNGSAQIHNFSATTDVDWVKFVATQGVTYTLTAAGTGIDAYPNLEIWSSCTVPPPGAFGTTSRLQFVAPTATTYYLRLDNDQSIGNPATTSYELSVVGEGTSADLAPAVTSITPAQSINDRDTGVTITGSRFRTPGLVELCPMTGSQCDSSRCGQLLDTSYDGQGSILAVVPANTFAAGPYCVAVTNQDGQVGTLANAFTVQAGTPVLSHLAPAQAYSGQPVNVTLYGHNLFPGLTLALRKTGSTDIPLENLVIARSTQAHATLPAGLEAATYSLVAAYPLAQPVVLDNAFHLLAQAEDLFAQPQELWTDPVSPRAGEAARVGLIVHRQGGEQTTAVRVRFTANSSDLGEAEAPLVAPDSLSGTEWLSWTPPQAGSYLLTAQIDPNNQIDESTENNNVVTQTVTVLPAAPDVDDPRVDSLTINAGQTTVTTTQIYLNANAVDYPQSNPSGVASLRYVEYEYNAGSRLWIPVQDSQWIDYAQARNNYRWTLSPVGGNHYLQAWAKDHAGNVSTFPYQTGVDYTPPLDRVGRDQIRFYRRTLQSGDRLEVTVQPQSGDPDLYIWPPDWQSGRSPWVSNRTGSVLESMAVDRAPVDGVYQIEVYGYSLAQYTLEIRVNDVPQQQRIPAALENTNPLRTAPLIDPNSAPLRNTSPATVTPTPVTPTPVTPTPDPSQVFIYLPAVLQSTTAQE